MNANTVISQILELHGEFSQAVTETADPTSYLIAKSKTEAMNDLLNKISNDIKDDKKRAFFDETIQKHFDSFSKGLFWHRSVNLEE